LTASLLAVDDFFPESALLRVFFVGGRTSKNFQRGFAPSFPKTKNVSQAMDKTPLLIAATVGS